MPSTGRRTTHARSPYSRYLFLLTAVSLLLSLHGISIAGTYQRQDITGETNTTAGPAVRDGPLPPLRSSLGTFAVPQGRTAILSLQGACRSELKLYCSGEAASSLRCLVEQFYRLKSSRNEERAHHAAAFSDVCEAWLTARDACLSFVYTHGKELCGSSAKDARECLRQIPAAILPPKCVTSDYYEGVRLVGRLRQHQTEGARLRKIIGE
ncbi:hypothetical protein ABL78_1667 [Leptomonas seymouri]|uniref:Enriched in surface-labeled proteome protein 18 n=1 Tax=Leptomonas seymouri TaxID=5684 RepID=A0A0N1I8L4_LEPSE|nr:hypothetical protein ABL78_1667 [Leptomonas seymouri]|eukprot:KPI89244.1 hypothetical protein ABL78_1667 [Leptomonas seymouri]